MEKSAMPVRIVILVFALFVHSAPLAAQSGDTSAPDQQQEKPRKVRTDKYGDPLPRGAIRRLGTERFRGWQANAYFLPGDKELVLVAGVMGNSEICVAEIGTGKILRRIPLGRDFRTHAWSLCREGKTIVVLGSHGLKRETRLRVLDFASGRETFSRAVDGTLHWLAASPKGETVALAGGKSYILVVDLAGRRDRRFDTAEPAWRELYLSPDGTTLLALSSNVARVWDTRSGKERVDNIPNLTDKGLSSGQFSLDGKLLATCKVGERRIQLWDTRTWKVIRSWACELDAISFGFTPNGRILAAAHSEGFNSSRERKQGGALVLWDVQSGKALHKRSFPGSFPSISGISHDGKKLVTMNGHAFRVWDMGTVREVTPIQEYDGPLLCARFSPSDKYLAAGSLNGTVALWDTAAGKLIRVMKEEMRDPVTQLVFCSGSGSLVTAGLNWVNVWELNTGRAIRRFTPERKRSKDKASMVLACSPDGQRIAARQPDGMIRIFDCNTGKEDERLALGPTGMPHSMSFLENTLVVEEIGRGLRVWDLTTRKQTRELILPRSQAYPTMGPDGKTMACLQFFTMGQAHGSLVFGNVRNGKITSYALPPQHIALSATFSPDGRMLAWGNMAGDVYLWEMAAAKIRAAYSSGQFYIRDVTFSPDGRSLASAGFDSSILIWDTTGNMGDEAGQALSEKDLRKLWADLASPDAERAFRAMGPLTARPNESLPFFEKHLLPATAADPKEIARLIADLDHERFQVREKARYRLEKLGELAAPALRESLKKGPTEEARRRMEKLLDALNGPVTRPDRLREVRAVEILERIGSPRARALLERLSRGTPAARLTREAKESLERLQKLLHGRGQEGRKG
jgi:WD40 repeat protein